MTGSYVIAEKQTAGIGAFYKWTALVFAVFMCLWALAPRPASAAIAYTVDSNLMIPRSVSASEMDAFIRAYHPDSPLIGHSQMWIDAQNKYGIDAVYLMAHAILESGWGLSDFSVYWHNIYGYGIYDSGPDPYYQWPTFEACTNDVAGWILEDYLSPTGGYYTAYGPTLRGMSENYASAGLSWAISITSIMNDYYTRFPYQPQAPLDSFWSRAFVKQLYRNSIMREAGISEANGWVSVISQNYYSRRLVALMVLDSAEGNAAFITTSLYQGVLRRDPATIPPEDVNTYVGMLSADTSERELTASFYGCPEYFTRSGSTNYNYVAALYTDILGRSGTAGEIQSWANAIAAGATRTDVAYAILSAGEAFAKFISGQYIEKLGRGGSPSEIAVWVNLMASPSFPTSERQVKYNFLSSNEFMYTGLAPFINSLYQNTLGRDADSGGYWQFYNALIRGTSRYDLAAAFVNSTEAHINFVGREYLTVLGRASDPGMMGWVGLMDRGVSGRQVTAYLYGSDEYYGRSGGTLQAYVTSLYAAIIGRGTTPAETAPWINAMINGMARETVAAQFLTSREYQSSRVRVLYTTNLHRGPTDGELATWIGGFTSGWTEEQFRIAVLSSDEYAISNL